MSINQSALNLLSQLKGVMSQMTQEQFAAPVEVLSGSSIGQHIRHTLEFFVCLLDAQSDGEINYDKRPHDPSMEKDLNLAMETIDKIMDKLSQRMADFPMTMKANYEINEKDSLLIKTSYHRELAYNIEHAIHHLALVKVGVLTSCTDVKLPDHFGVASSTVRYHKTLNV